MPQGRTPALEYRWFKTDITKSTNKSDKTADQTAKLQEFEKLKIAGKALNTVTDLGLAYAPIPFINWLGLFDQTVSGDKLEQANDKDNKELDNIIRSRLSSVDNIEVVFAKGVQIKSGEIAASKVKKGDKLKPVDYEAKQFSVGFPGELTVTTSDGKTPLFPVIERASNQKSTTRSKGISKTLFEAWALQLPGDLYQKIAGIRLTNRSKLDRIAPKFSKEFFTSQEGQLLPPAVLDAEIVEEEQLILRPSTTLYLPPSAIEMPSVAYSGMLFEDII